MNQLTICIGSFAVVFTGIWYFRKKRNAKAEAAEVEKSNIRADPTRPGSAAANVSGPLSLTSERIVGGDFPREMWTNSMRNPEDQIHVGRLADQMANGNDAQAYGGNARHYGNVAGYEP